MRDAAGIRKDPPTHDFPSFSEGLSLRGGIAEAWSVYVFQFPFLFGGTFIEGTSNMHRTIRVTPISLPFRRDFH